MEETTLIHSRSISVNKHSSDNLIDEDPEMRFDELTTTPRAHNCCGRCQSEEPIVVTPPRSCCNLFFEVAKKTIYREIVVAVTLCDADIWSRRSLWWCKFVSFTSSWCIWLGNMSPIGIKMRFNKQLKTSCETWEEAYEKSTHALKLNRLFMKRKFQILW